VYTFVVVVVQVRR